jgi:hypothetical protein
MRISRIDIKRDDSILRVENWPSVNNVTAITIEADLAVESSTNLAVLSTSVHATPICQDGVCQLGAWKPTRNAA